MTRTPSLRAALLASSCLLWLGLPAGADDLTSVREKSAVCDPNAPLNCLKPAANGSIAVTGGGGGGSSSAVQYNSTQPPVASGASTTPQSDAKGNTYVTPAPNAPNFPTSLPDLRTTGQTLSAASGSTLILPLNGAGTLGLAFSGLTASGATVTFSASNDGGTTYTPVGSFNAATGVASPTYSTDGQTRIDVGGRTNVKLTVTTAGTGNITVSSTASQASSLGVNTSPLVAQAALGRDIGAVEQFGSWTVGVSGAVTLGAGSAAIGSVSVSNFPATQPVSGTVTANQGGAPWSTTISGTPSVNNAQVNGVAVSTGTGASNTGTQRVAVSSDSSFAITNTSFAVTQSGTWNVGLLAGSAIVGKVGIDQTTPGTTNKVSIGSDGTVTLGAGSATVGTVNLGTIGAAATATNQTNVQSAPGTSAGTALTIQGSASGVPIPTTPTNAATVATAANQNSTAAGTSATNAQGVQGVTGGVALPVSGTVTANLGTLAGAATAANQSRFAQFPETPSTGTPIAASNTLSGTIRAVNSPANFTRLNAFIYSTQSGSLTIKGCFEATCSNGAFTVSTTAISGSTPTTVTAPVLVMPYAQVSFTNGTTAGTVFLADSFTSN